jgi:hypothetical protein
MTAEHPPIAEHWLTYAETAERLGLTPEAVRALARRQHWPRRSPNAVGGQTWILVPADRLAAAAASGNTNSGQRTLTGIDRRDHHQEPPLAASQETDGQRAPPGTSQDTGGQDDRRTPAVTEHSDRRIDDVLAAVRETAETFAQPLRDQLRITHLQIEILNAQLGTAHERADRAEGRAQDAERRVREADDRAREAENRIRETEVRVRELQEQLQAEMIEHRQMVALLLKRRSWWPWRRQS